MKKVLYNLFDKSKIANLPTEKFSGRIITILTKGETEKAVEYLLKQPILGFDTETKPAFKKGVSHKVALLQVATRDTCFLFRLNHTGLTPAIIKLLEDKNVKKVALAWHDDILSLHKRGNFNPGTFVELQQLMPTIGIEDKSLQKLYANFFGKKISKRQQLSNWDADVLNDKQKLYAATDAWACIKLYEEFKRLRDTNDYELQEYIPEEG